MKQAIVVGALCGIIGYLIASDFSCGSEANPQPIDRKIDTVFVPVPVNVDSILAANRGTQLDSTEFKFWKRIAEDYLEQPINNSPEGTYQTDQRFSEAIRNKADGSFIDSLRGNIKTISFPADRVNINSILIDPFTMQKIIIHDSVTVRVSNTLQDVSIGVAAAGAAVMMGAPVIIVTGAGIFGYFISKIF